MSKIKVLTIIKKHGIRDKVKLIKHSSDDLINLAQSENLLLNEDGKTIKVEKLSFYKDICIASIPGCNMDNFIDEYKGIGLFVDRELCGEELIIDDYIGLSVIVDGEQYGTLTGILDGGASCDMAEVMVGKEKEYYIFNEKYFYDEDIKRGVINLRKPETESAF